MDHQFRYLGFANFTSVFHMEQSDFFWVRSGLCWEQSYLFDGAI